MTDGKVTEKALAELVELTAQAASAIMRGDIDRYVALINHADDYTLMPPNGGETRRGFDRSEQALKALADMFRSGEAQLEVVQSYASGDLAVLVAVERQHGQAGPLPAQDWSLRVTLVFRLEASGWRLVHRHADPLVQPIRPELFAAIARGEG